MKKTITLEHNEYKDITPVNGAENLKRDNSKNSRRMSIANQIAAYSLAALTAIGGYQIGKTNNDSIQGTVETTGSISNSTKEANDLQGVDLEMKRKILELTMQDFHKNLINEAIKDPRFSKEGDTFFITIDTDKNIKIPVDFEKDLREVWYVDSKDMWDDKNITNVTNAYKDTKITEEDIDKLHTKLQLNGENPDIIQYGLDNFFKKDEKGYYIEVNMGEFPQKIYNNTDYGFGTTKFEDDIKETIYGYYQDYSIQHTSEMMTSAPIHIKEQAEDYFQTLKGNNITPEQYQTYRQLLETPEARSIQDIIDNSSRTTGNYNFSKGSPKHITLMLDMRGKDLITLQKDIPVYLAS